MNRPVPLFCLALAAGCAAREPVCEGLSASLAATAQPGRCTYYIDDTVFDDDPRLNERHRRTLITGRGGNGLSRPVREADGRGRATRNIILGTRVPGCLPRS